jgi:hypothetical protein
MSKRGEWKKSREDRGVLKRGHIYYIRFRDQAGKTRVERVGASKTLARRAYAKRKTEVDERRFFPATGVSFREIVEDAIALAREAYRRKHPGRRFKPGNYGIIKDWFPGRAADSITPSEIAAKLATHTRSPRPSTGFASPLATRTRSRPRTRSSRRTPDVS